MDIYESRTILRRRRYAKENNSGSPAKKRRFHGRGSHCFFGRCHDDGAFSLIVSTAINLTNRSNAMIDADQTFQVDYYKSPDKRTEGTTAEITTTISLVLNLEKTDAKNNASNLLNGLELPKAKLQKYTHENGIYRYYVETDSNGNTQP